MLIRKIYIEKELSSEKGLVMFGIQNQDFWLQENFLFFFEKVVYFNLSRTQSFHYGIE